MTKLNENKKKKNIFSFSKQNLPKIGYVFRDSFSFIFSSPPFTTEGEKKKHETRIKSTSLGVVLRKNTNTVVYV